MQKVEARIEEKAEQTKQQLEWKLQEAQMIKCSVLEDTIKKAEIVSGKLESTQGRKKELVEAEEFERRVKQIEDQAKLNAFKQARAETNKGLRQVSE